MNEWMYGYYGGYIFNIKYNSLDSVQHYYSKASRLLPFGSDSFRFDFDSVANSGIDLNHLAIYILRLKYSETHLLRMIQF